MSTYTEVRRAQQARTDASKARREASKAKTEQKRAASSSRNSKPTKSTKRYSSSSDSSSASESASDDDDDSDSDSSDDDNESSSEEVEDSRDSVQDMARKGIQPFMMHYDDYEKYEDEALQIVKILSGRANIKAYDKAGDTLLHLAAVWGHDNVVKVCFPSVPIVFLEVSSLEPFFWATHNYVSFNSLIRAKYLDIKAS
jgi:hypothetical protein